jgi:ribonuclease HII
MNKILLLFVVVSIFSFEALAQNKEQLEKKREQLLEEIKYTQNLLKSTKANKQISIADLNAINKQIELRQKLINNTQAQVNLFNNQIVGQKNVVEKKSAELEQHINTINFQINYYSLQMQNHFLKHIKD